MSGSTLAATPRIRRLKLSCTTGNAFTSARARAARTGRPPGIERKSSRHRDCLNINELPNSFRAELAAEPGTLCPSKRQPRIRCDHAVDENHPGFECLREKFLLDRIGRPGAGSQSERTVVRDFDGFCGIADAEKTGDWPEDLLAISGRVTGNVCEHGRLVEKAGALDPLSTR